MSIAKGAATLSFGTGVRERSADHRQIRQLSINTIRTLSIDAVERAKSGHPGAPMGLAPVIYTLWQDFLRFDPEDAKWPNRDRFVLSNGHASMMLYSMLFLAGVRDAHSAALTLDDLKRFRQIDGRTPGHPEYGKTPGVETTTGPLGQGCGNSIGMALAGRWLAGRFNKPDFPLFSYDVYAFCGDGDMMEGVASEAASFAGHQKLGNLCWLYDHNSITIEGSTLLAFSEDVAARFRAYGWKVHRLSDANDTSGLARMLENFRQTRDAPTLIVVDSHIGYGAPHKQDTGAAHGEPLGEDEARLAKKSYGWPEDAKFLVPDGVREHFAQGIGRRGRQFHEAWQKLFKGYCGKFPELAGQIERMQRGEVPDGWDAELAAFPADAKGMATREASGKVLNAIGPHYPWLAGGAADLAPSTKTHLEFDGAGDLEARTPGGRNMHFGVREHAMGSILNGMALAGLRPYGATFLIFSDYMKPPIRLAALMELPVIYVFTHDSIGLGEDGPTHQPVEQLLSLRSVPGLLTLRPADANEVVEAYRTIIKLKQPAVLALSRQPLPTLDRSRYASADGVSRGAYVLADADKPAVILIGTGSEVRLCVEAYEQLKKNGVPARVVSMPSWELFEAQDEGYRDSVLPPDIGARVSVEMGSVIGWDRYVGPTGAAIGMHTFGASAPIKDLLAKFGFTVERLVAAACEQIEKIQRIASMNVQAGRSAPSAKAAANPLAALHQHGQAPWLDFLARKFIADGSLKTLVERDGVTGVTSNPSIFEKAIGGSDDYDASLKSVLGQHDRDVMSLYESLAIEDIRNATAVLLPVYKATTGDDGYVSLEVSPYLAMDTDATVAEAQRLWREVSRDNLMIKVPATKAGLPAIRRLIGEGINVNITLLFSQDVYEAVVEAYLGGLEDLLARGGDPSKVASVASFFVSRIDVAVDKLLDDQIKAGRKELSPLRGKVAIANAKLAYQRYKRLFSGPRWEKLKSKGARTQRLLWASTGTKNKNYSDVLYVDEMIADNTVNTLPPSTMDAFRDHGKLSDSLEQDIDGAKDVMAKLAQAGISIDEVTLKLVDEGVELFADAFDKLLGAVTQKRAAVLGNKLDTQAAKLPAELDKAVKATLEDWRGAGKIRQLWAGDARLWTNTDEAKWVGWLDIVDEESKRLGELQTLSQDVRKQRFSHAVLLGMGGSSLGPEVLAKTFGNQDGGAQLVVLDSTDPAQVRTVESKSDPARTLFIVSSKSGSTLEPNVLKEYFFDRAKSAVGADAAGSHFIAITDPGSSLEKEAKHDGFRNVFYGKPSIGGRYSVLSNFGLVPAAVMGLDPQRLLDTTGLMVRSCGRHVPPAENPGVILGAILGNAAKAGRDKVTIIASHGIADFGAWLEQLIAESTGKHGKGLVPVDAEPPGKVGVYGQDRVFAYLRLASKPDLGQDEAVRAIEAAGHAVVRIEVTDAYHIGQEFFRWEIATAVAGAIIGINPFDQPDVEASKDQTRALTSAYEKSGALPPERPFFEADGISLYADQRDVQALGRASTLGGYLSAQLKRLKAGDYFALLAYIERNDRHAETLQDIRRLIRDRYHVATCFGFGPRFLHSTGQAYKGGPNSGVFLQITCDDATDVAIPGRKYSFGTVKAAQARGDFEVLVKRQRRALRVHLGSHVAEGLTALKIAIREALG